MNLESQRLRTFETWPVSAPVDSLRIARAGFYYTGQNLEVQCFSCGGRISEWQYGDKVMVKHRLLDPRCPFVLNPVGSGNVPITSNTGQGSLLEGTSNATNWNRTTGGSGSSSGDRSKYKTEAARLETFVTWPIPSKVEGFRLAKAGFYYLQELDKVRCAFCGIDAYNWEAGDDPIVEHRRHSPLCPFLSNISVGSSSQDTDDVIVLRNDYYNFESDYGLDASRMKDFGILNHRIPKHSKYMTEESRIMSFERWPISDVQNATELAKAGFYYTGVEDKVRCYHCGGGLQKWRISDDPWVEHAKWFSDCDFVFLVKGEEFINEIKQQNLRKIDSSDEASHSGDGQGTSQQCHKSSLPQVDDNTIQHLMTTAPVLTALELGLDVSRIKQVLRDRLERNQKVFNTEDDLIAAVLDAQFNEPVADLTEETWIADDTRSVDNILRLASMDRNFAEQSSTAFLQSIIAQSFQNVRNNAESIIEGYVENSETPPEPEITNSVDERVPSPVNDANSSAIESTVNYVSASTYTEATETEPQDAHSLEEENRRLKEAKLCKICMDRDVNIVFLPCGHLVTCSCCAANIPDCPVCRQIIKGTVRTFLA